MKPDIVPADQPIAITIIFMIETSKMIAIITIIIITSIIITVFIVIVVVDFLFYFIEQFSAIML